VNAGCFPFLLGVDGIREVYSCKFDSTEKDGHEPVVNDSPQPHASLILGFLNANLAL
jgi:hypothetical protein